MTMDDNWLDGNGVAGLLQEVFGDDMTNVERRCHGCGEMHAVGAHRAYIGAGLVLRCPGCADLAATIVRTNERHVVQLSGAWMMR
jgi:hypothetical protein